MPMVSAAACLLVILTGFNANAGWNEPISFQLNDGVFLAWVLVGCMISLLGHLGFCMARQGWWFSSALLFGDVIGLLLISLTNPLSRLHESAYILTGMFTALWMWLMAFSLDDGWLQWLAAGAIGGLILSIFIPGIGERILIGCCLGGLFVQHSGYVEESPDRGRLWSF